jgi:hypothetical protein
MRFQTHVCVKTVEGREDLWNALENQAYSMRPPRHQFLGFVMAVTNFLGCQQADRRPSPSMHYRVFPGIKFITYEENRAIHMIRGRNAS